LPQFALTTQCPSATATANASRECLASSRTATEQPGRTPRHAAGGAFDVGWVDIAARHDDVFEPPAHHDIAGDKRE
jgi:hypothetical protein